MAFLLRRTGESRGRQSLTHDRGRGRAYGGEDKTCEPGQAGKNERPKKLGGLRPSTTRCKAKSEQRRKIGVGSVTLCPRKAFEILTYILHGSDLGK